MYWHLILTEKCNSRCRYCYEKSMKEFDNGLQERFDFDFKVPVDSEVDIEKLKNFISKDKNPKIIFYGGEPLLQIEKIKKIMDEIPAEFFMQTNGKLLGKLPKEYMNKFKRILISIDGDKKRTDFNRGEGTYDLILRNIKLLRDNGFGGEIVARMTIAQEFPDVFEQIKYLIEIGFYSVHWQIDAGFYKNDFDKEKFSEFVEEYNKSISKLIDFWLEEISKGNVLKFYPFLGIFETLYYNKKEKLRCGSGYANYTITTNGKIAACPIMNNIKDFYCGDLDSKELKEINIGGKCGECGYLDLCGGRCLYSNKAQLWPEDGEKLICETIKHLVDKMKGVFPTIKNYIEDGIVSEKQFEYEKYFGPEIIP